MWGRLQLESTALSQLKNKSAIQREFLIFDIAIWFSKYIYPSGAGRPFIAFGSSAVASGDSFSAAEVWEYPLRPEISKCDKEPLHVWKRQ